jgi:hypothetical protein
MVAQDTINKAIQAIEYAIKHGITVKEASVKCGFSDTYVKNVKARILKSFDDGDIDPDEYTKFLDLYNTYSSKTTDEFVSEEFDNLLDKTIELAGEQIKKEEKETEMTIEFRGIDEYEQNEKETPIEAYERYQKNEVHVKTLEGLLDACNVNTDLWQVKHHVVNKWDVTSWKNGFAERRQNWQVKAFLEKKINEFDGRSAANIFAELIKDYTPPVFPAPAPNFDLLTDRDGDENNLLEICIFDLHLGKLAWGSETNENFDVNIASERFMNAIYKLLNRVRGYSYSRILFPIGNDFFNVDNLESTTTAGTPQHEDVRWQRSFKMGCKLVVDGIELLKQQGVPVDVVIIAGNHDQQRSYYLGSHLEAWYRNDPMVKIDNREKLRKYYRFGDVLLGFTHGKYERESALPMLMATEEESIKDWAQTKFREWHLGHIHRKRTNRYNFKISKDVDLDENFGITMRYLSSLTGTEHWHYKMGFVGAIKAADAFVWNDEAGLLGHFVSNMTAKEFKLEQ